jgi:type I restriction enzyme, S subunit
MKLGWQVLRLGDVCEFDKSQGIHAGLPYVGLEDIESHTARFIGSLEAQVVKSSTFKFSTQHVLYGRLRPYLNKVLAPEFAGHCSTEIFPIKPGPFLSREYLLYWFLSGGTVERINATCTGARMPRADMNEVLDFDFPIPSLPQQQFIVKLLDDAFDGIATAKANAEKNLQNAQALVSTGYQAITEGYDSSKCPIVQVTSLAASHKGSVRTGPFGSQLLHSEFVDDGIAVLGIDNAVKNEFRWDRRRYITAEKYRQLSRYRVLPGDVLITIMGTCGRCAVVPEDIPQAINTKHLCCITLDRRKCLPEFLHIYFLYDALAKDYLNAQAKGSIMAGLNMGIILELPVRLPSLQQQAEIVQRFSSLRAECLRLESIYQQKLAALDELKKSLLHQAFSGHL